MAFPHVVCFFRLARPCITANELPGGGDTSLMLHGASSPPGVRTFLGAVVEIVFRSEETVVDRLLGPGRTKDGTGRRVMPQGRVSTSLPGKANSQSESILWIDWKYSLTECAS